MCGIYREQSQKKGREKGVRATRKWCSPCMLRPDQEYKISSKVYEQCGWKHVRRMCALSCSNEIYFCYLPIWSFFPLSLFSSLIRCCFFFRFFSPFTLICKNQDTKRIVWRKATKKGYLVGMVVTDRSGVFYVAIVLRFQIFLLVVDMRDFYCNGWMK